MEHPHKAVTYYPLEDAALVSLHHCLPFLFHLLSSVALFSHHLLLFFLSSVALCLAPISHDLTLVATVNCDAR